MDKTDTVIVFRSTAKLKKALQNQANKEGRTLSNLILKVLNDYKDSKKLK